MNKKSYLIIIFLIAASCIFFGRIAGNHFINFDDPGYLTKNYQIQSGLNFENIKWAFTAIVVSNWHPLTLLSHMLDWSLFGNYAGGHHLVSLLWHIGTVILLFLFLYKTTNNIWPSAFAAAFFALHPLRVESVAWASERKDVLSMFFGMASIYTYAFYVEKNKISRYCLCLIFFMLSLMSKPMLVTLPFVLLLLDYWPLRRWQTQDAPLINLKPAGKLILEKIPFFILTFAACIAAIWAHHKGGSVSSEDIYPFIQRAANAIVSFSVYLSKIIWPHDLVIYYPYNFSLPMWKILISGLVITVISIIVLRNTKKMKFLFVGWFWYLGTLMPVIGLMQVGSQAMADRYTYLPSIGIAIMLAWGIPCVIKNENIRKKFLFPSGIFVIAILALLTWHQCGYWRNSITLFSRPLKVTENNYIAHNHLANALVKARKLDKAFYHYNKAIQINPIYAHAYYNRGIANYLYGRKQLALADFQETIRLMPKIPKSASAYHNIGIIYAELGQYQTAIDYYNEAIGLKPDYADAYYNRALVYFEIGDKNAGCRDVQKACELGNCATMRSAVSQGMCR